MRAITSVESHIRKTSLSKSPTYVFSNKLGRPIARRGRNGWIRQNLFRDWPLENTPCMRGGNRGHKQELHWAGKQTAQVDEVARA